MRTLNLPRYSFKIKSIQDSDHIFDPLRKKYVKLTPEEWVRQNFVQFLISDKGFPGGRIVIEKSLSYNKMIKRCDILAYGESMDPLLIVECKAPEVKIKKEIFDQIAVYNMNFKLKYLIVTNGLAHYFCTVDFENRKVKFLNRIPDYRELSGLK